MIYIAFRKDWISTMKIGWGSVANSDSSHGWLRSGILSQPLFPVSTNPNKFG